MAPNLNPVATLARASATMSAAAARTEHAAPISLAYGEPVEAPPREVVEAIHSAVDDDRVRYGPAAGLDELRELAADLHSHRTGLRADPESVVVTSGGKGALMNALRCMLQAGDEVLILAPYWPSYLDMVQWCDASPVVIPPRDGVEPDLDALAQAVGPRTKAIILNTPSNPSGRLLSATELQRIGALAREADLWLISDEVYRELSFNGPAVTPLVAEPSLMDRVVSVESFSKRFSMTGYRVGLAHAPVPLARAMTALQSASTTHPSTLSQLGAVAALQLDGAWELQRLIQAKRRCMLVTERLAQLPGFEPVTPRAAFYVVADARALIAARGLEDDLDLCASLSKEIGVHLTPGSAFGLPDWVRFSCAPGIERLEEALGRIEGWCSSAH